MKKLLIILVAIISIAVAGFLYFRSSQGMDLPQGESGPQAEALAEKMLTACHVDAWDETRFVQWTFAGRNSYVWDRSEGVVEVSSGESRVILNTADQTGWAWEQGESLTGEEKTAALASAWANFCNDSFWLIAPFKVLDPGSSRALVSTDEGDALLVNYASGGVTPGDSYLWYIAEDGFPYAYRMWTQILPVPGLKATWEDWTTLHTGAKIATKHSIGPASVDITGLDSGSTLTEIGLASDHLLP